MKIRIISDTHTKHNKLTNALEEIVADVIIYCGDMTSNGTMNEIRAFMEWFGGLNQFTHKICIAGNHDFLFEDYNLMAREVIPTNVIYLEDEGCVIDNIKFYGTPAQPIFLNWAFNKTEHKLKLHWEAIPDDTDVLITHSPPYGVMDWAIRNNVNVGSKSLYMEVFKRIRPKIHCFGHIHYSYGTKVIDDIVFVNASNLDEGYRYTNPPIIVTI